MAKSNLEQYLETKKNTQTNKKTDKFEYIKFKTSASPIYKENSNWLGEGEAQLYYKIASFLMYNKVLYINF